MTGRTRPSLLGGAALFYYLVAILSLSSSSASAASSQTFCKCTCFTNSTIIPLGPSHGDPVQPPLDPTPSPKPTSIPNLQSRAASSSCGQCNRAFCLKYNLPICKDAEEKDVLTSCFQRDSTKDQIIVWGFIIGTVGLLGWAGLQRVIAYRESNKARSRGGGGSGGAAAAGTGVREGVWGRMMMSGGSGGVPGGGGGRGTQEGVYTPLPTGGHEQRPGGG